MKQVEPEYVDVIRSFFNCQVNVGILGGRPGEAYYLVGIQDEHLIFLDPHCTVDSIKNDLSEIKANHMGYHESIAKKIHYSKLDPSLGFAFLLRKESNLEKLRTFMHTGKSIHKKSWIFHALDKKPDYMKSKKNPLGNSDKSNPKSNRSKKNQT